MMPSFSYVRPATLGEAVDRLARRGARLHAGGTDLLGCLRDGVFGAEELVSLSGLRQLSGIERTPDNGFRLGALTTIAEVAANAELREAYPGLAEAAGEVGSPQLRNQGTLGGNLCQKPRCWYYRGEFPCLRKGGAKCYAVRGENSFHAILGGAKCFIVHPSDTAPVLAALGALVRVVGPGGARVVPAEEFLVAPAVDPRRETVLEPQEIVTEILLPAPPAGLRSSYRKVRARRSWDFAVAAVALALRLEDGIVQTGRLVFGGAAPIPWRATSAEKALEGRPLTPENADDAAEAALETARPLEQNAYKVPMFKGLLREELRKLAQG
jgi:xanthine dehydrogenase YagS FAD-binding subunit